MQSYRSINALCLQHYCQWEVLRCSFTSDIEEVFLLGELGVFLLEACDWMKPLFLLFLFPRVDEDRLRESSPVLARLFLQSIFISVDIRIREGHLFCDCLCDSGPPYSGQVSRKKFQVGNGLFDCTCRVTVIDQLCYLWGRALYLGIPQWY